MALYRALPEMEESALPRRGSLYSPVPRTGREMYLQTKNANSYYFGALEVELDNRGDIRSCRERGFRLLETRGQKKTPSGREGAGKGYALADQTEATRLCFLRKRDNAWD